ncbi:hypothetical protein VTK26DRAFT_7573 [Humicola hyalothermophila]
MEFYRVVEHTIDCAHTREYVTATANGDADRPRLAVKQYIPLDNPNPQPGDVTIIGAHANGFPKELYEPLWDELHKRFAKTGTRIRAIWIADMWNQGQSGVLNERILGNDPSWSDHARDLTHLINMKRDEMPHPLVGVGHSMGAAQLAMAALSHPRLFHSLCLLDPVIQIENAGISPATASTFRRDLWDSRAAAAAKFQQSKFYQAWDPRVLDLWVRHGLRDLPTELYPSPSKNGGGGGNGNSQDGPVTLTTSKHQELFTFLRPTYRTESHDGPGYSYADRDPIFDSTNPPGYPFYRPEPLHVARRLPELRPSVLYVFGAESDISAPPARADKMARTGTGLGGSGGAARGRVKEVVLDCGHLVAMERVGECADAIAGWVAEEVERWKGEQRRLEEGRRGRDRKGVITVDARWEKEIKPRGKEKAKI